MRKQRHAGRRTPTLLPVGSRTEVLQAIAIVIPNLGVTRTGIESRARRHARPLDDPDLRSAHPGPPEYNCRAFGLTDAVYSRSAMGSSTCASIIPAHASSPCPCAAGPALAQRGLRPSRIRLCPVASMAEHVDERALQLWADSAASKVRRVKPRKFSRVTEVVEATR